MSAGRIRAVALTVAAAAALLAANAEAHFTLNAPAASTEQDDLGNPQKSAPCGPADGGTPTGEVTTFAPGETITISLDETVYHPGHYRVALAVNDPSELPAAPPVTPTPDDECAMTTIEDPPMFPVLADGMLEHNQPFGEPQSFQVTLPDDISCDNCTLQVIQYMSSHAAPCFYYHCATIAIADSGATASSSSATSGGSGGAGAGGMSGSGSGSGGIPNEWWNGQEDEGGCSCTVAGSGDSWGAWGLAAVGLVLLARRRRSAAAMLDTDE